MYPFSLLLEEIMNTPRCFKKMGKPRRNVYPRYLTCVEKVRYRHVRDAVSAADRYMDRVPVLRAPMVPYYCPAHSCWHIGHDTGMSKPSATTYAWVCIHRERLRDEIDWLSDALGKSEPKGARQTQGGFLQEIQLPSERR